LPICNHGQSAGNEASDDGGAVARGEAEEIARREPALPGEDIRGAEQKRREQADVGDDAAGAGGNGEPAQQTSSNCRAPGRPHVPGHDHDRERGPGHRREERNVDRGEEQAAVEISGHQTKRDGGKANPAAGGQAPQRQQCGNAGKSDQESHGVSQRDPIGKIERLDVRREHLKPRPVIPKRKFHGLEMRAVDKSARVPRERLGPVVVGVELVDGEPVVGSGCKPQHQDCAQQGGRGDELGIDPKASFRPPLERTGECRQPWYLRSSHPRTGDAAEIEGEGPV
jgi:hypothetical protein